MYNIAQFKNAGAWLKGVEGIPPYLATAGGTGDNSEVLSAAIERKGALSAVVLVPVNTTGVSGGDEVDVAVRIVHGPTSGVATGTYQQPSYSRNALETSGVYNTAPLTLDGTPASVLTEWDINLEGCDLYFKVGVTVNFDAANTDTATFAAVVVLAGFEHENHLPQ